jgi:hypothetical protein
MKPVKADGAKGDRKERYEKDRPMKNNQRQSPAGVDKLETATPIKGEPEHRVWTDRMLKALDEGVKGGKWFSLIDKVWSPGTLLASFRAVKANGGAGGTDGIIRDPSGEPGYPRLAAQNCGRWVSRPFAIAWCRELCAW